MLIALTGLQDPSIFAYGWIHFFMQGIECFVPFQLPLSTSAQCMHLGVSPIRDVGSALYSSTPSPSSPLSWRRWRLGTAASPMFIGWSCPTFWDLCQWSQDYGVWTPVHHHINLWCTLLLGQAQFSEISLTKKGRRKKTKNPP